MKKRLILVTGAAGFIGRNLARYFGEQADTYVVGLGHGSWSEHEWRTWGLNEWHGGDVTMEALCACAKEPDLVIHCAGGGAVGFSVQHPREDFERTVVGTSQLLEFLRRHAPGASLLYPSSAAVYGASPLLPILEDSMLAPVSPYGVHKQMAEQLCAIYAKDYGVKTAIVRLFSVYGPGLKKQLLWDASGKLMKGNGRFPGTGSESRDWVHINDITRLMALAAERAGVECPVYNGGCGTSASVAGILRALQAGLGAASTVLEFSGETRPGDPAHMLADSSRARALGWAPTIPWNSGVADYAAWYLRETISVNPS